MRTDKEFYESMLKNLISKVEEICGIVKDFSHPEIEEVVIAKALEHANNVVAEVSAAVNKIKIAGSAVIEAVKEVKEEMK